MGDTRRPSVSEPPQGLRERKKVRNRMAIRREAFRLFREQGFANTTIDQITQAAEVSPRTFYRYFGVKEAVLISDDLVSPIVAAFTDAPRDLTYVAAYQYAVTKVFSALSPEERDDAVAGQQLMYEIPEARGLLYAAYARLIDLVTEALAFRQDTPTEEFERRVIAGAIVGVLFATSHNSPLPEDELMRALTILDVRLS